MRDQPNASPVSHKHIMQEISLQSTVNDTSKPGAVPWIVAILALIAMAFLLKQQLNAINKDVISGVRTLMSTSNVGNQVKMAVDGRDVTFSGTVSSAADRDWFVSSVSKLDAVRVARDDMEELDPRQQTRLLRQKFRKSLQAVDTSVIAFEPNSAAFASSSEASLQQLASLLLQHPERRIKVAGHTDSSGRRERNLELSRERARAVTTYLQQKGVPAGQLISQGYGSTQPIDTNDTEAGRANNRRIDIIVMN